MTNDRPVDIDHLAAALTHAMSKLAREDAPIALAVYLLLAKGEPVHAPDIASVAGLPLELVQERLAEWPGVFTEAGAVVGFWGLAIPEMAHRFEVDGRILHTWCAYDALFIPELIRATAHVRSVDPVTKDEITLTVSPERVETAFPESTVMSFLDPASTEFNDDVILNFCSYVHFFGSLASGSDWVGQHPGTFLLTLTQAAQLAHQSNRSTFGPSLAVSARR